MTRAFLLLCALAASGALAHASFVAGAPTPAMRVAYKTADESVSSSTALQTDDHLTLLVEAGQKYRFRAVLFMDEASSGMKIAVGGTATATAIKGEVIISDSTTRAVGRFTALDSAITHGTSGDGDHYVTVDGAIEVNVAGTFAVRWAQNASDAAALVMQRGSTFEVTRL